jgi:hypothetical protein
MFPYPNFCKYSSSLSCFMPCPSHPPWLDHSNTIWWELQFMKLLVMQYFPASPILHSHWSEHAT